MSRVKISEEAKKRYRDKLIFGLSCTVCLLLVVCAVWFSVQSYNKKKAEELAQISAAESSRAEIINQSSRPSASQSSAASSSYPAPSEIIPSEPESEAPVMAPPAQYMTPLAGAVGQTFSDGVLVFSETMGDWRFHGGIDFLAKEGDSVCAVGDGMVTDFYFDELTGHTMEITHPDGLISVYCGLNETAFAETGEEVLAGDIIGSISGNIPFESAMEPHLHLEIIRDGARIDPLTVIG